jgi:hypothetical protein
MKTTLFALLGVSLFLGGCGARPLRPALGGAPESQFARVAFQQRDDDHATLKWNAAGKPLAAPPRFRK